MNFNHFNKPCMPPPSGLETLVISSFRAGEELVEEIMQYNRSVRFEYICNDNSRAILTKQIPFHLPGSTYRPQPQRKILQNVDLTKVVCPF